MTTYVNPKTWRRKAVALLCVFVLVITGLIPTTGVTTAFAAGTVSDIPIDQFTGNPTDTGSGFELSKADHGDNHAVSNTQAIAFRWEADVTIPDDPEGNALLTFGIKNRDNVGAGKWYGVCINRNRDGDFGYKIRIFDVNGSGINEKADTTPEQRAKTTFHYKVTVDASKTIRFYLDNEMVLEVQDPTWDGGYVGLLSWNAKVVFNNIEFEDYNKDISMSDYLLGKEAQNAGCTITEEDGGIVLSKRDGGDNHATSSVQAETFTYEADAEILDGSNPLLTFGVSNREDPTAAPWYGICPNRNGSPWGGEARLFKVVPGQPLAIDEHIPMTAEQISSNKFHLKVTVDSQKVIRFYLDGEKVIQYKDDNWAGGYIGLLSWNAKVKFTNIKLTVGEPVPDAESGNFNTNLTNLHGIGGTWTEVADGFKGRGSGDCFAMSDTTATDFIYEAKVNVKSGDAASLVFGAKDAPKGNGGGSYIANVDLGSSKNARIFKFVGGNAIDLINYSLPDPSLREYTLRVESIGGKMSYYVNGALAGTCVDTSYPSGKLGLLICNSTSVFQDVLYTPVDANTVKLSGLSVTGVKEMIPATFDANTYAYTASVPYATEKITVTPSAADGVNMTMAVFNKKTGEQTLSVDNVSGAVEVSLAEGENTLQISTEKDGKSGITTTLTVKREINPENYYKEPYRPQYHITPEVNWLNDPNGLVYYDGEYHVFYQYNPDTKFPHDVKHWAHVVSTDLVHWEQLPVALSPDEYGNIWSGSCVVDKNNTSGFFTGNRDKNGNLKEEGMVAFYTCTDPSVRQQQSMAYSKDNGRTWIKYQDGEPFLKSADDPLNDGNFRDPKVFWHEESNQWMMIIAGGPARFYSSKDLKTWKFETGYRNGYEQYRPTGTPEIYSECADFYKMPIEGQPGKYKWIYSAAGEWYMIGDFKQDDQGRWGFFPDTNERYRFGFAPDIYAGVTFNNLDRRIMVQWMTNIGYASDPGHITDPWNGALTLPYELKLVDIGNSQLRIVQDAVPEMDSLRTDVSYNFNHVEVSPETPNILSDIQLDKGEFDAVIDLGTASEVGFKLRTGNGQQTVVKYDVNTQNLTIDRSKSGKNPNDRFASAYSTKVAPVDGKIDLHMFLDWSSLEVFGMGGQACGTALIFPDPDSVGMEFYAKGGTATVESLDIYELGTVFGASKPVGDATAITLSTPKNAMEVGEQFTITAVPTPVGANMGEITWDIPSNLEIVSKGERSIVVKALQTGEYAITANAGGLTDTMNVSVIEKQFRTNLEDWVVLGGSWETTADGYQGTSGGNGPTFSQTKASDFVYEGTFTYKNSDVGGAFLFRATDDYSTYYSLDICERNHNARILKFNRNPQTGSSTDVTLGKAYTLPIADDHTYQVKIEAKGENIKAYINGELAVEVNDASSLSGKFGLNVCDITGAFQDVYYQSAAAMSDLSVSSGSLNPVFSPDVKEYTVNVENAVDSIQLTPTLPDGVKAVIGGKEVASGAASENIALDIGENKITISLTGAMDTNDTYTVTVIRAEKGTDPEPNDPALTGLELSKGTLSPAFASGVLNYTASVDNTVSSVKVKAFFADEFTATIQDKDAQSGAYSDPINLNVGENTVTVKVKNAIGKEAVYTIVITRKEAGSTTKPDGKPSIPGGSGSDWKWPDSTGKNDGKVNPNSGDTSALPIALALLTAGAAGVVVFSRKKRK
ncbi:cadherin-like beta sandwich domain-containing protein [Zongyangia hominis]|uniref:Cadherin-like beta sandwich domain-containing protein n=2 Tax=Zongyangia hominis TaxID=2763677 RepID=A0A926EGD9_9FIRM|nr:cadherin-like beta sandwich domain-containing protein [Zongyangia hominis]MBC8571197.1 cadherin-like beta sandwich domain-containing protein [Zongyangia hominis]